MKKFLIIFCLNCFLVCSIHAFSKIKTFITKEAPEEETQVGQIAKATKKIAAPKPSTEAKALLKNIDNQEKEARARMQSYLKDPKLRNYANQIENSKIIQNTFQAERRLTTLKDQYNQNYNTLRTQIEKLNQLTKAGKKAKPADIQNIREMQENLANLEKNIKNAQVSYDNNKNTFNRYEADIQKLQKSPLSQSAAQAKKTEPIVSLLNKEQSTALKNLNLLKSNEQIINQNISRYKDQVELQQSFLEMKDPNSPDYADLKNSLDQNQAKIDQLQKDLATNKSQQEIESKKLPKQ